MLFRIVAIASILGSSPALATNSETLSTRPLADLIEKTAAKLEDRLNGIRLQKGIHLEMQTGRGLSLNAARKFFFSAVLKNLKQQNPFKVSQQAPTKVRLMVSLNNHRIWVVGTVDSRELLGPTPFVLSHLLTEELRIAFGIQTPTSPSLQWRVRPLGEIEGQILDLCVMGWNADTQTYAIAVLDTSGIQVFHFQPEEKKLQRFMGHAFLKSTKAWPRIVAGWIGKLSNTSAIATTTRGDHLNLNITPNQRSAQAPNKILIGRTGSGATEPFWATYLPGNPNLQGPIRTSSGKQVSPAGMPKHIRDAHPNGSVNQWYWVDSEGYFHNQRSQKQSKPLLPDRIGDRFLFADIDGDGAQELVHTLASFEHQSDALVVRTLPTSRGFSPPRFRTVLAGGSIVAMDRLPSSASSSEPLLIGEQTAPNSFRLWLVEVVQ